MGKQKKDPTALPQPTIEEIVFASADKNQQLAAVGQFPPLHVIRVCITVFGVLLIILFSAFVSDDDPYSGIPPFTRTVEINQCYVRVKGHCGGRSGLESRPSLTLRNDTTTGNSSFPSFSVSGRSFTLENSINVYYIGDRIVVDGTKTLNCALEMCVEPGRTAADSLRFLLDKSVLNIEQLEGKIGVLNNSTKVNLPTSQSVLYSVEVDSINAKVPVKIFVGAGMYKNSLKVNISTGIVSMTHVEGNIEVANGFGPLLFTRAFNPSQDSNIIFSGSVEDHQYCVSQRLQTVTASPCQLKEYERDDTIFNVSDCPFYASWLASTTTRATTNVDMRVTSLYINDIYSNTTDPTGLSTPSPSTGDPEPYNPRIAGAGMEETPKLDPRVSQAINNTKTWRNELSFKEYVQTVEVLTPTMGVAFMVASRRILMDIGPEFLTFYTAYALQVSHRGYWSLLSHYRCVPGNSGAALRAFEQQQSLTAPIYRNPSEHKKRLNREQLEALLLTVFSNEDQYDIAAKLIELVNTPQVVAGFLRPDREVQKNGVVANSWSLYQLDKTTVAEGDAASSEPNKRTDIANATLKEVYTLAKVKKTKIGVFLQAAAAVGAFIGTMFTFQVIIFFRVEIAGLLMLSAPRKLYRAATSYDKPCFYGPSVSLLFFASYLSFHTARGLYSLIFPPDQTMARYLSLYYSALDPTNDDPVVIKNVPWETFMRRFETFCLLRLLKNPHKREDIVEFLAKGPGGRISQMDRLVVPQLKKVKNVATNAEFSLDFQGFSQFFVRSDGETKVLFENIMAYAVQKDANVDPVEVQKALDAMGMPVELQQVPVVTGVQYQAYPETEFLEQYVNHVVSSLEFHFSSFPSYAFVLRSTQGPPFDPKRPTAGSGFVFRNLWLLLGVAIETGMTMFFAFAPFFAGYLISMPLELEHEKYSTTTEIIQAREMYRFVLDIPISRPRNYITTILWYVCVAFIILICVDPIVILVAYNRLSVPAAARPYKFAERVLVAFRLLVSALIGVCVVIFTIFVTWYVYTVMIWWVLGVLIAPERMAAFAASVFMFVFVVVTTVQDMKRTALAAQKQLEDKIMEEVMKLVASSPKIVEEMMDGAAAMAGAAKDKVASLVDIPKIDNGMYLDVMSKNAELADRAIQKMAVALQVPKPILNLLLKMTQPQPITLRAALDEVLDKSLQVPAVFRPMAIQLVNHLLGFPVRAAEVVTGLVQLVPKEHRKKMKAHQPSLVSLAQVMLDDSRGDKTGKYIDVAMQVLTAEIPQLNRSFIHVFNIAKAFVEKNILAAARAAAGLFDEWRREPLKSHFDALLDSEFALAKEADELRAKLKAVIDAEEEYNEWRATKPSAGDADYNPKKLATDAQAKKLYGALFEARKALEDHLEETPAHHFVDLRRRVTAQTDPNAHANTRIMRTLGDVEVAFRDAAGDVVEVDLSDGKVVHSVNGVQLVTNVAEYAWDTAKAQLYNVSYRGGVVDAKIKEKDRQTAVMNTIKFKLARICKSDGLDGHISLVNLDGPIMCRKAHDDAVNVVEFECFFTAEPAATDWKHTVTFIAEDIGCMARYVDGVRRKGYVSSLEWNESHRVLNCMGQKLFLPKAKAEAIMLNLHLMCKEYDIDDIEGYTPPEKDAKELEAPKLKALVELFLDAIREGLLLAGDAENKFQEAAWRIVAMLTQNTKVPINRVMAIARSGGDGKKSDDLARALEQYENALQATRQLEDAEGDVSKMASKVDRRLVYVSASAQIVSAIQFKFSLTAAQRSALAALTGLLSGDKDRFEHTLIKPLLGESGTASSVVTAALDIVRQYTTMWQWQGTLRALLKSKRTVLRTLTEIELEAMPLKMKLMKDPEKNAKALEYIFGTPDGFIEKLKANMILIAKQVQKQKKTNPAAVLTMWLVDQYLALLTCFNFRFRLPGSLCNYALLEEITGVPGTALLHCRTFAGIVHTTVRATFTWQELMQLANGYCWAEAARRDTKEDMLRRIDLLGAEGIFAQDDKETYQPTRFLLPPAYQGMLPLPEDEFEGVCDALSEDWMVVNKLRELREKLQSSRVYFAQAFPAARRVFDFGRDMMKALVGEQDMTFANVDMKFAATFVDRMDPADPWLLKPSQAKAATRQTEDQLSEDLASLLRQLNAGYARLGMMPNLNMDDMFHRDRLTRRGEAGDAFSNIPNHRMFKIGYDEALSAELTELLVGRAWLVVHPDLDPAATHEKIKNAAARIATEMAPSIPKKQWPHRYLNPRTQEKRSVPEDLLQNVAASKFTPHEESMVDPRELAHAFKVPALALQTLIDPVKAIDEFKDSNLGKDNAGLVKLVLKRLRGVELKRCATPDILKTDIVSFLVAVGGVRLDASIGAVIGFTQQGTVLPDKDGNVIVTAKPPEFQSIGNSETPEQERLRLLATERRERKDAFLQTMLERDWNNEVSVIRVAIYHHRLREATKAAAKAELEKQLAPTPTAEEPVSVEKQAERKKKQGEEERQRTEGEDAKKALAGKGDDEEAAAFKADVDGTKEFGYYEEEILEACFHGPALLFAWRSAYRQFLEGNEDAEYMRGVFWKEIDTLLSQVCPFISARVSYQVARRKAFEEDGVLPAVGKVGVRDMDFPMELHELKDVLWQAGQQAVVRCYQPSMAWDALLRGGGAGDMKRFGEEGAPSMASSGDAVATTLKLDGWKKAVDNDKEGALDEWNRLYADYPLRPKGDSLHSLGMRCFGAMSPFMLVTSRETLTMEMREDFGTLYGIPSWYPTESRNDALSALLSVLVRGKNTPRCVLDVLGAYFPINGRRLFIELARLTARVAGGANGGYGFDGSHWQGNPSAEMSSVAGACGVSVTELVSLMQFFTPPEDRIPNVEDIPIENGGVDLRKKRDETGQIIAKGHPRISGLLHRLASGDVIPLLMHHLIICQDPGKDGYEGCRNCIARMLGDADEKKQVSSLPAIVALLLPVRMVRARRLMAEFLFPKDRTVAAIVAQNRVASDCLLASTPAEDPDDPTLQTSKVFPAGLEALRNMSNAGSDTPEKRMKDVSLVFGCIHMYRMEFDAAAAALLRTVDEPVEHLVVHAGVLALRLIVQHGNVKCPEAVFSCLATAMTILSGLSKDFELHPSLNKFVRDILPQVANKLVMLLPEGPGREKAEQRILQRLEALDPKVMDDLLSPVRCTPVAHQQKLRQRVASQVALLVEAYVPETDRQTKQEKFTSEANGLRHDLKEYTNFLDHLEHELLQHFKARGEEEDADDAPGDDTIAGNPAYTRLTHGASYEIYVRPQYIMEFEDAAGARQLRVVLPMGEVASGEDVALEELTDAITGVTLRVTAFCIDSEWVFFGRSSDAEAAQSMGSSFDGSPGSPAKKRSRSKTIARAASSSGDGFDKSFAVEKADLKDTASLKESVVNLQVTGDNRIGLIKFDDGPGGGLFQVETAYTPPWALEHESYHTLTAMSSVLRWNANVVKVDEEECKWSGIIDLVSDQPDEPPTVFSFVRKTQQHRWATDVAVPCPCGTGKEEFHLMKANRSKQGFWRDLEICNECTSVVLARDTFVCGEQEAEKRITFHLCRDCALGRSSATTRRVLRETLTDFLGQEQMNMRMFVDVVLNAGWTDCRGPTEMRYCWERVKRLREATEKAHEPAAAETAGVIKLTPGDVGGLFALFAYDDKPDWKITAAVPTYETPQCPECEADLVHITRANWDEYNMEEDYGTPDAHYCYCNDCDEGPDVGIGFWHCPSSNDDYCLDCFIKRFGYNPLEVGKDRDTHFEKIIIKVSAIMDVEEGVLAKEVIEGCRKTQEELRAANPSYDSDRKVLFKYAVGAPDDKPGEGDAPYAVGDYVECCHNKRNELFAGHVVNSHWEIDGTFDVEFFDGSLGTSHSVPTNLMRKLEPLEGCLELGTWEVDQYVKAWWHGALAGGVIMNERDEDHHEMIRVLFDDSKNFEMIHYTRILADGPSPSELNVMKYEVEQRVEAKWKGRAEFFPAKVVHVNPDHVYRVVYETGDPEIGLQPNKAYFVGQSSWVRTPGGGASGAKAVAKKDGAYFAGLWRINQAGASCVVEVIPPEDPNFVARTFKLPNSKAKPFQWHLQNDSGKQLVVERIDEKGKPRPFGKLLPKETRRINTQSGVLWKITDASKLDEPKMFRWMAPEVTESETDSASDDEAPPVSASAAAGAAAASAAAPDAAAAKDDSGSDTEMVPMQPVKKRRKKAHRVDTTFSSLEVFPGVTFVRNGTRLTISVDVLDEEPSFFWPDGKTRQSVKAADEGMILWKCEKFKKATDEEKLPDVIWERLKTFDKGDAVEVRYGGGEKYYKAKVHSAVEHITYAIKFDDGNYEANEPADKIRPLGPSPAELRLMTYEKHQRVEVIPKGSKTYLKAKVFRVRDDGTYDVMYDDGVFARSIPVEQMRPDGPAPAAMKLGVFEMRQNVEAERPSKGQKMLRGRIVGIYDEAAAKAAAEKGEDYLETNEYAVEFEDGGVEDVEVHNIRKHGLTPAELKRQHIELDMLEAAMTWQYERPFLRVLALLRSTWLVQVAPKRGFSLFNAGPEITPQEHAKTQQDGWATKCQEEKLYSTFTSEAMAIVAQTMKKFDELSAHYARDLKDLTHAEAVEVIKNIGISTTQAVEEDDPEKGESQNLRLRNYAWHMMRRLYSKVQPFWLRSAHRKQPKLGQLCAKEVYAAAFDVDDWSMTAEGKTELNLTAFVETQKAIFADNVRKPMPLPVVHFGIDQDIVTSWLYDLLWMIEYKGVLENGLLNGIPIVQSQEEASPAEQVERTVTKECHSMQMSALRRTLSEFVYVIWMIVRDPTPKTALDVVTQLVEKAIKFKLSVLSVAKMRELKAKGDKGVAKCGECKCDAGHATELVTSAKAKCLQEADHGSSIDCVRCGRAIGENPTDYSDSDYSRDPFRYCPKCHEGICAACVSLTPSEEELKKKKDLVRDLHGILIGVLATADGNPGAALFVELLRAVQQLQERAKEVGGIAAAPASAVRSAAAAAPDAVAALGAGAAAVGDDDDVLDMVLFQKLSAIVRLATGDPQARVDLMQLAGVQFTPKKALELGDHVRQSKMATAIANMMPGGGDGGGAAGEMSPFERAARFIFDELDEDRSGEMDLKEFNHGLKRMHLHLPESEVRMLFTEFDTSGEGFLSFEEFCACLGKIRESYLMGLLQQLQLTKPAIVIALCYLILFMLVFIIFLVLGVIGFSDGAIFTASIAGLMPLIMSGASQAKDNAGKMKELMSTIDEVVSGFFAELKGTEGRGE